MDLLEPIIITPGQFKVFPARFALRAQRLHVLLCNVLPIVGTVVAFARATVVPITVLDVAALVSMWALTLGLGGTVGFHRYLTHRSFETSLPVRILLVIAGSMAAQGSPLSWVSTHRRHHENSDKSGDPHSPNLDGPSLAGKLTGFFHAHCGWLIGHDIPNPGHYAKDLLADRAFVRVNTCYYLWVALGLLLPTACCAAIDPSLDGVLAGFLWGGCVRICLTTQVIWSINSLCHTRGFRSFATPERSVNNVALALPSFGESWHNNHHAFPYAARFGHRWWQIDLGYYLVLMMRTCGLVWDVKRPPAPEPGGKWDPRFASLEETTKDVR